MISIIVPVYNCERYLFAALLSLQKQSFSDFEVICLDDGSRDSSADIIEGFVRKDSRFRYIRQNNAGPGGARNRALEEVRGAAVLFQDADDLLHPNALEIMDRVMRDTSADIVICGYDTCKEGESSFHFHEIEEIHSEVFEGNLAEKLDDWKKFRGHPWGKLYRRTTIGDIRFPNLMSGEDTYFNLDVYIRAHKITVLPVALYCYRQNNESLTHTVAHYSNTICSGKTFALHCLTLLETEKINRRTAEKLLQRHGTNALFLGLLQGVSDKKLSLEKIQTLQKEVRESLKEIKKSLPSGIIMVSPKYTAVDFIVQNFKSLLFLRAIVCARIFLLTFLRTIKCK